jgi:tetratricopeptide (TPR) repeat protein
MRAARQSRASHLSRGFRGSRAFSAMPLAQTRTGLWTRRGGRPAPQRSRPASMATMHGMNSIFSNRLRAAAVLLAAMLQGCASTHGAVSSSLHDEARPVGTSVETDSAVGLRLAPADPDLAHAEAIFAVMQAELALQRKDFRTASLLYLRAAKLSGDVAAAIRGTRYAVHANATDLIYPGLMLWVELGRVEHARGEQGRERAELKEALRLRALLRLRADEAEAAEEDLVEWLALDPEAEREGIWNQILGFMPRDPEAKQGDAMLARLRQRYPDDIHAQLSWARWPVLHGDLDEGQRRLDQLLLERPDAIPLIVLRSRMLWDAQQREQADHVLRDAIARLATADDVFELQMELGRLRVRAGDRVGAREIFAQAYALQPANPTVLRAYALLLQEAESFAEAETVFSQLRDLEGHYAEASFLLGQLEDVRKNPEAALSHYAVVPVGHDNYLTARLRMAVLLADESIDAALGVLDALEENLPSEARILQLRGALLTDAERYAEAVEVFTVLIDAVAEDTEAGVDARYARAMAYERLDQLDAMQADLQAVLAQDPKHYHALNALGYTLADRLPSQVSEAVGYLQRALELKPDDFYVLDSMGWALYRMGELEQALDYLQRAWAKKVDAEAGAHLGEVLWQLQRRDEALAIWAQAYAENSQQKVLLETLQRFAVAVDTLDASRAQ